MSASKGLFFFCLLELGNTPFIVATLFSVSFSFDGLVFWDGDQLLCLFALFCTPPLYGWMTVRSNGVLVSECTTDNNSLRDFAFQCFEMFLFNGLNTFEMSKLRRFTLEISKVFHISNTSLH